MRVYDTGCETDRNYYEEKSRNNEVRPVRIKSKRTGKA